MRVMIEAMTRDNKPNNPELAVPSSPWKNKFLLYDPSPKDYKSSIMNDQNHSGHRTIYARNI